jgi:hypothetical protein
MPPTNVPVSVVANFSGVSYDPSTNQWSGDPTWNVPAKTAVRAGSNTIQWTLRPAAVPQGFVVSFPASLGIAFGTDWPYDDPGKQTDGTYTVNDTFTQPPASVDYEYTVNVVITSEANTTISKGFSYDPDIENEGGSLSIE